MEGAATNTLREHHENGLLDTLTGDAADALRAEVERVYLAHGTPTYDLAEPFANVYFPIDAVISIVTIMRDGQQIEVMTVGREGLCGAQSLLGDSAGTTTAWCQVAGEAYRMPAATFRSLADRFPELRDLVGRYLSASMDAMAQSIACNRLHYVNERCARWLLMTFDRVGRPDFPLTHEILATMLGVRRAGVSIAAAALQEAGYIRYVRGKVTVVDPAGLETVTCECYAAIKKAFSLRRLTLA